MRERDEMEIDLLDLLAAFFRYWWFILVTMIACGGVAFGLTFLTPQKKEADPEALEAAKNELSPMDANDVERLYDQYYSYMEYKRTLQEYFSEYLFSSDDADKHVRKIVKYSLESNLVGATTCFMELALDEEVYDRIRKITPDMETITDVYHRLNITSSGDNRITLSNAGEEENVVSPKYVLSVYITASNEGQCDEIQTVIDEAFQKQVEKLRETDPDIRLQYIGENYTKDIRSWVVEQQQTIVNEMQSAESAMLALQNNQIKNLSANQKNYFNALLERDQEEPINPAGPSKLKNLLMGMILGLVLAAGCICVRYLFDGKIKTAEALGYGYHVAVLDKITLDKRKSGLFGFIVRKLRKAGVAKPEVTEELLASDLSLVLSRRKKPVTYFLCTSEAGEERKAAETIGTMIKRDAPDAQISIGLPLESAEELKKMAAAGSVVLFAELKKSPWAVMGKYVELCRRHGLDILGAVVVEEF